MCLAKCNLDVLECFIMGVRESRSDPSKLTVGILDYTLARSVAYLNTQILMSANLTAMEPFVDLLF